MKMSNKPQILLDADVLIHLFKAEKISILNDLFKGRVCILDVVVDELRGNPTIKSALDSIFIFSGIEEIIFPTTSNEAMFGEFVGLKDQITGDGERATLLFCKYNHNIIASSNTSDIIPYCELHSIGYLTTIDIFCIAIHNGIMDEKEVNQLIKLILFNKSYLCCHNFEDHFRNHFNRDKYLY